jgi:hypothetical protein
MMHFWGQFLQKTSLQLGFLITTEGKKLVFRQKDDNKNTSFLAKKPDF